MEIVFPLSYGQKALWFLHNLSPNHCAYNINISWQISKLDIEQLKYALQVLTNRHPSLRTTYYTDEESRLFQKIHPEMPLSFKETDVSNWSEAKLCQTIDGEGYKPFKLDTGPVSRWMLYTKSSVEHILFFSVHHISFDFGSMMIFMGELSELLSGKDIAAADDTFKYGDFIKRQQKISDGPKEKNLSQFWDNQLSGELTPLNLPTDKPRPPALNFQGDRYSFKLPSELTQKLSVLAKKLDISLYSLYLSVYNILLHRYTGQDDILTSSPVSGRTLNYNNVTGYFVNPLVFRSLFPENIKVSEFVKKMHQTVFSSLLNKDYPFLKIVEKFQKDRDLSRAPIAQAAFNWLEPSTFSKSDCLHISDEGKLIWTIGDMKWEQLDIRGQTDDFDLLLNVFYENDKAFVSIEYNNELFNKSRIERMAGHLEVLFEGIVNNPESLVSALPLLTEAEKQKILVEWNDTKRDYPLEECFHRRFENQVEIKPDAIAVIDGEKEYSYKEINIKANQLAHYLQGLGVGPEKIVGILVDRSVNMIIAILGVLKAGGAYLPIDLSYPKERIGIVLDDAKASIMVTQQCFLDRIQEGQCEIVCLDRDKEKIIAQKTSNPKSDVGLHNLIYVIFTSGSTGRPKGVAVEHRNVSAFINTMTDLMTPEELDGVLVQSSISFDMIVFEIYVPLSLGGKSIIAENALHLAAIKNRNKVKTAFMVPSAVKSLLEIDGIPESIITYFVGGEPTSLKLFQNLYKLPNMKRIYHSYGPTETTVVTNTNLLKQNLDQYPDLGKLNPNNKAYILDKHLQPVPIGVPGEWHLGGSQVVRGYLNDSELTNKRFVQNPFSSSLNSRLYKTGDLARYKEDGSIEYIGRVDFQVKIHGFRIELGDIEAAVHEHSSVHDALVTTAEDHLGDNFLVGYVVLKSGQKITSDELRNFLKNKIPAYMVPLFIMILDSMPLNINGKIDRKALPKPKIAEDEIKTGDRRGPRRSKTEQIISKIWCDVLNIKHIGIHESFFDIGGHSLLMVKIFTIIKNQFDNKVSLIDLYRHSTIHQMAGYLDQNNSQISHISHKRHDVVSIKEESKIAIIGMSCRFPGASNLDQFWENIKNGIESISEFSNQELLENGIDPVLINNPNYVNRSGFIDNIDQFDADFFGFNPMEAKITDPQHRIFLECAWEAIENAGINIDKSNKAIGVYAGCGQNSYYLRNLQSNVSLMQTIGAYSIMIGNDKDFLSTKASYKLNLNGPAITVQTACSTSLVAVHMACSALLSGDCDTAMAGGVSLGTLQKGYLYQKDMILSPNGQCRSFDAAAMGTVASQGAGIVILKRLKDALKDGNHIYAVIIGTAVNNDGSDKAGYTAPSIKGQANVIKSAHKIAGISSDTITYVEAHGTGTLVGDPIEIRGLADAFNIKDKKNSCAIGSIKTNIGHTDAAAGVAGLIKTAMALKYKILPPSLNFEYPNPDIDFKKTPFYVNTKLKSWDTDIPRRAGVSSFGLGGTNAHVVLEEIAIDSSRDNDSSLYMLPLSAKSSLALDVLSDNLKKYLEKHQYFELANVAHTLQTGRKVFEYKKVIIAKTLKEVIFHLDKKGIQGILIEKDHENHPLVETGKNWLQGFNVNWDELYGNKKPYLCPLPAYPFERKRYWVDPIASNFTKENTEDKVTIKSKPTDKISNIKIIETIKEIWSEFLGHSDIGENDDYFELGGDSLIGVMIAGKLRDVFKVDLSNNILITKSTIALLAEYISEKIHALANLLQPLIKTSNYTVELKQGSASPPLFLCHPGAGHLYFYMDIVRNLDLTHPIYGIEAVGLHGEAKPLYTIEDIAAHHVEQILKVKKDGHCWVAGSSFGGMAAYEAVQQLKEKRYDAKLLYMADTPGPGHMIQTLKDNAHILSQVFAELFENDMNLENELRKLEGDIEKQIQYIINHAKKLDKANIIPPQFGSHFIDMLRIHMNAMMKYIPKPYDGSFLFFRCTQKIKDYDFHPELSWLPLAEKGANVITIPGNHITINSGEGAKEMAKHIKRYIEDMGEKL